MKRTVRGEHAATPESHARLSEDKDWTCRLRACRPCIIYIVSWSTCFEYLPTVMQTSSPIVYERPPQLLMLGEDAIKDRLSVTRFARAALDVPVHKQLQIRTAPVWNYSGLL